MAKVFISHATADKWLAKMICEKIEGTGATPDIGLYANVTVTARHSVIGGRR